MTRLMVAGVLAMVAGAAAGGWAFGYGPLAHRDQLSTPTGAVPVAAATVTAGTIAASEEDSGTIGYRGSFTVYGATAGTVTWLPATGAVIRPGRRLFAVDGQDVTLLRGQTPAWRAFSPGMTDGPDIAELQRNLVALGYDPYHAITPDGHYGWATEAAIERWQAAGRWTEDGRLQLGQVVFLPGPIRVASVSAGLGATVAAGTPVIVATSTTAVVTVALPAGEQSAVTAGQRVTINLPDGGVTTGRVVGPAPVPPAAQGTTGPPTVSILVTMDDQTAARGLDGSPVQVAITTRIQRDALISPISALLASSGGGFQVTVVAGDARHDVTVQTGLFDNIDGTVAISGPGITAGTQVEVPRS